MILLANAAMSDKLPAGRWGARSNPWVVAANRRQAGSLSDLGCIRQRYQGCLRSQELYTCA